MRVIADLIAAGVDKDLVARVADEIANARAEGAASASMAGVGRTARQDRNARYYDSHKDDLRNKRLKASETSELRRVKTGGGSPSEVPPKNNIKPPPTSHSPVVTSRGARLPSDWQPNDDHRRFAGDRGLTFAEVVEAGDEFRDFWAGVPGSRGTKLDWDGTFRNRLREIAARKSRAGPNKARAGPSRPSTNGIHSLLSKLENAQQPHHDQGFAGSDDANGGYLTLEGELSKPH